VNVRIIFFYKMKVLFVYLKRERKRVPHIKKTPIYVSHICTESANMVGAIKGYIMERDNIRRG